MAETSSTTPENSLQRPLALVMGGGGARAAYQVGLLRCIAREKPDLKIQILTGVSAGAINAAFLASRPGHFHQRVDDLASFWAELQVSDVFQTGRLRLFSNVLRAGIRLISGGGGQKSKPRQGMVDTKPLATLLKKALHAPDGVLRGVSDSLANGELESVAVTAASYTTGRSVTFLQGKALEQWERPTRKGVEARLSVEHVMASSALPLLFPAIEVGDAWYGDGGMRLSAPLAPAVHLGAERIIAISTRYARSNAEAEERVVKGYPPAAQVAGVLLNSVFIDMLDADALRLERINRLVRGCPPEKSEGLRPIDLLVLRPSKDLGRLANEYEAELPKAFRFLTRGLGTKETRSNDLLSLLMFQPNYLKRLMELGEADADARRDELMQFVSN